jgi:hypothetical protein
VAARQKNYRRVFFENAGYQPYLYVVSFTGMTPREYMTVPKDMDASRGRTDVVRRVGKYFFLDSLALEGQVRESTVSNSRDLFVARKLLPGTTVLESCVGMATLLRHGAERPLGVSGLCAHRLDPLDRKIGHRRGTRMPSCGRNRCVEGAVDAMNSIGMEAIRFVGQFDVMARIVLTDDLDRNFAAGRANGNFVLGVRQNF